MSEVKETTVRTVESNAEPDPGPADSASTETIVASQGAVAVAAEAVALSEATSAAAELQAAETVATAERSFRDRVTEIETWRGQHEVAMGTLATELEAVKTNQSSIQGSLTELLTRIQKLSSTEVKPISEVTPDENVVVENQEPVRKRHRLI